MSYSPKFKQSQKSLYFKQTPPSSRLLSQPPQARFERLSQVGRCHGVHGWKYLDLDLALGPGQGLVGRPWPSPHFFVLTNKNKTGFFLFSEGGRLPPHRKKKHVFFLIQMGVRSQIGISEKKYGPGQSLPASLWPGPGSPSPAVLEVQIPSKMSVPAQIIKNGPNRVQNRRFGLKIGPEACQDRSGALWTGPAAKKSNKVCETPHVKLNCRTKVTSLQTILVSGQMP